MDIANVELKGDKDYLYNGEDIGDNLVD